MLRRLGPSTETDLGAGVCGVSVDLEATKTPSPVLATAPAPAGGRRAPLLSDPVHRHALRTRDQVCPWFH